MSSKTKGLCSVEYECEDCNHIFEIKGYLDEEDILDNQDVIMCPRCGSYATICLGEVEDTPFIYQ